MEGSVDEQVVNYKKEYRNLKRKIRYLIYENETFQETLRKTRRSLLKVSRDKNFLLDQLLEYENVPISSSESDETESSDEDIKPEPPKRKKAEPSTHAHGSNTPSTSAAPKTPSSTKKKRPPPKSSKSPKLNTARANQANLAHRSDGLMTPEEIERHLTAHQPFLQLMPEKAPLTVPTDFFSNDPSRDRKFLKLGHKFLSSTF